VPESVRPSQIPGKPGGATPYVLGVAVLAALIGGLIYWKRGSEPPPPPPLTTQNTAKTAEPVNLNPPPPPPPPEEDAGAPAASATAGPKGPGPVGPGACGKCGEGQSSPALNAAVTQTAQSAQGCYQRALRTSEVSGSMTVSVQVGSNGSVCNASVVNDSVHSGDVTSCVLGKFRGRSYPSPTSGCVVVNVPISFKIKQ
jgi:hypothetical protein